MYKIREIVKIVNGKLLTNLNNLTINKISTDTRKEVKNSLFIPIIGENFDGHNFIKTAYEKGAIASLTQKKLPFNYPNLIIVDNTLKAYGNIAKDYVRKNNIRTIAITGTSGKTTVKELLAYLTSISAPEKSYNNLIGVPETIFQKGKKDSYLILEFGTNKKGEISRLTEISNPEYGILTNIGFAHLEGFKDFQEYIEEKLSLIKNSKRLKKVVVFWDNKFIQSGLKNFDNSKIIKVTKDQIINFINHDNYSIFKIKFNNKIYNVKSGLIGFHNAINFLLSANLAYQLGFPIGELIEKIEFFKPVNMRFEIIKSDKGFSIINDCYNANFESFKASLESLNTLPKKNKKIAVIGDILELGKYSKEIHKKVGELINKTDIDIIFAIGSDIKNTMEVINNKREKKIFTSKKEIAESLKKIIAENDLVFFKASRKIGLEDIIKEIV